MIKINRPNCDDIIWRFRVLPRASALRVFVFALSFPFRAFRQHNQTSSSSRAGRQNKNEVPGLKKNGGPAQGKQAVSTTGGGNVGTRLVKGTGIIESCFHYYGSHPLFKGTRII